jgi:hypothetical protein
MSNDRIDREVALLRSAYPALEYVAAAHWIRLPNYSIPPGWDRNASDVAFQVPEQIPGQAPHGFYVPGLALADGRQPDNYAGPVETPWGNWMKFSWQLNPWFGADDIIAGSNMLNFARSISNRLKEGK